MSNQPFPLPVIEESRLVFEESLIKIRRDMLRKGQQPPYRYYSLLTRPFAVVILATTPEESYVLIEEYRHPTGKILLGCPGGYIDEGEDPLESAAREFEEETGYRADSFELIGSAFPYAGVSAQKTFYIKAKNAVLHSKPKLEPSEVIQTRLLSAEQLNRTIEEGIELDGTLCTALFFHARRYILTTP
ncbi:NUDIX hydrolase [Candidatus Protochlamydia phocaeensis]|uniref:NUDIX hydrolase n=1 Tax=Candidatus Protochlamydia phocaeensis TaxID=1414722 RepID=UPI0008396E75|nr:NUDIX hydrolase [Candidatus Protochlamydia phocaeensis]